VDGQEVSGSGRGNNGGKVNFFELPTIDLVLMGIAMGTMTVLMIMICLYVRLRREHAALEKDKVMGGSLRRMWDKFVNLKQGGQQVGGGKGQRDYAYKHLNMQEFSSAIDSGELSIDDDNQLDLEDHTANRR
jgi:hypothetical protein